MRPSRLSGGVSANGEWAVLAALVFEIVLFAAIAPNFATAGNFFEIARLSVELGLLAIALTPVLITGGIDLSVGSMMGLSAVLFGAAYRDWNLPIAAAAATSLLTGCAGGALNAILVARLGIPPLIVTLGTFSLFRGIAEGITLGAVNYTGFPACVSCRRAGVSVGLRSDATRDLRRGVRRLRDASAPFDHRPGAVRDRILTRPGPDTRVFRSSAAWPSCTFCPD